MSDNEIDYEEIRARVQRRINKRKELIIHAGAFFIVNIIFWVVWLMLRANIFDTFTQSSSVSSVIEFIKGVPIPLFVTGGWLIGLLIHALDVFVETGMMDRMRETEFQRELEREKQRIYLSEKPKRQQMHLTDDGELVSQEEAEAEDTDYNRVPARRSGRSSGR